MHRGLASLHLEREICSHQPNVLQELFLRLGRVSAHREIVFQLKVGGWSLLMDYSFGSRLQGKVDRVRFTMTGELALKDRASSLESARP